MAEKEAILQNKDERKNFRRYLYHPGDFSYQILKFDALKLLDKTPQNKIKEKVWESRGHLGCMPNVYKSETTPIINPEKFQGSAEELNNAKNPEE